MKMTMPPAWRTTLARALIRLTTPSASCLGVSLPQTPASMSIIKKTITPTRPRSPPPKAPRLHVNYKKDDHSHPPSMRPISRRVSAQRAGSAARGARPLKPGVRPPRIAIGREFFSNDLTDGVESRPPADALKQRVVDERLIVSTP